MSATIRIRTGDATLEATIVGVDPNGQPQWYDVQMVAFGGARGESLRFSLRRNGRYVVQGGDRDTGSYIVEEDIRAY